MAFDKSKCWIGAGIKFGGTLFVVGAESFNGAIVNLEHLEKVGLSATWSFASSPGFRLGAGLGGSGGLALIFVYGTQFFIDIHRLNIGGFGVNVALTEKFGKIKIPISQDEYTALKILAKGVKTADKLSVKGVITNIANNFIPALTASTSAPGGITSYVIDVPYAGGGWELSAVWTVNYKIYLTALGMD